MIEAFNNKEIDVGIGLTESWIVGLSKTKEQPYHIVGSYTLSPLTWAVSVGAKSEIKSVADLKGKKVGISRLGRSEPHKTPQTYFHTDLVAAVHTSCPPSWRKSKAGDLSMSSSVVLSNHFEMQSITAQPTFSCVSISQQSAGSIMAS